MKLLLLFCLVTPNVILSSTGGNCENVCNYQIDNYWESCLSDNCPQIGELCTPVNATTCVCGKNCQMCVDDLYNECGGCSNKYGYNFDKNVADKYKELAEDMGCNSAGIDSPFISLLIICLLISTIVVL
tara:strand:- start:805 stop:1191 length:387 start_codon:yes stop_codon:yes gene_type:complete